MNTVLMYVIMGLVCRFKATGGGFRNLKFDVLHKYIIIYSQGLQFQQPQITNQPFLSLFTPSWSAFKIAAILNVAMLCAEEVRSAKPGNHLNFVPLTKESRFLKEQSL